MVLVGTSLREHEYEEYDIHLPQKLLISSNSLPKTWNIYQLNRYFRKNPSTESVCSLLSPQKKRKFNTDIDSHCLDSELYQETMSIFKSIHKERFQVRLDWSAISEIIAIVFVVVAHSISLILAIVKVN